MRNAVVFALPLLAVPAILAPAPSFAAQSSFTGTYSGKTPDGESAQMVLTQAGDGSVTGTLSDEGTKLTLKGKVTDPGKMIEGAISVNGAETPIRFEVSREGDRLRFTMNAAGEETTIFFTATGKTTPTPAKPETPTRPGPAKPTAGKPAVKTPVPPTSVTPATGATYQHPSGVRLRLPEGWKMMETRGAAFALLPPGQSKPDGDELYLLLLSQSGDISSPDDPRIAGAVEQLLNGPSKQGGLFNGAVRFEKTGGSGNALSYEGAANNGKTIYARSVFSQPKGMVVGIVAVGLKSKIAPREKAMQSLVASANVGQAERDSRLVGTWAGGLVTSSIDARDSAGRNQASSATDSSTTFTFSEDGTYVQTTTSRTIAIGQGVALDSGDQVEKTQLAWCASNGKICFFLPNGLAVTGTYRFQGNALVASVAGKTYLLRQR